MPEDCWFVKVNLVSGVDMPTFDELAGKYVRQLKSSRSEWEDGRNVESVASAINGLVYEGSRTPLSTEDKLVILEKMRNYHDGPDIVEGDISKTLDLIRAIRNLIK